MDNWQISLMSVALVVILIIFAVHFYLFRCCCAQQKIGFDCPTCQAFTPHKCTRDCWSSVLSEYGCSDIQTVSDEDIATGRLQWVETNRTTGFTCPNCKQFIHHTHATYSSNNPDLQQLEADDDIQIHWGDLELYLDQQVSIDLPESPEYGRSGTTEYLATDDPPPRYSVLENCGVESQMLAPVYGSMPILSQTSESVHYDSEVADITSESCEQLNTEQPPSYESVLAGAYKITMDARSAEYSLAGTAINRHEQNTDNRHIQTENSSIISDNLSRQTVENSSIHTKQNEHGPVSTTADCPSIPYRSRGAVRYAS